MNQELLGFVVNVGETFMKIIPISLGIAVAFTVLTYFWACNPGRPWWRKPDLVTDLCYWFFIPIIARYFRIGMLIAGAALLFHITTADGLIAWSGKISSPTGPIACFMATSCGSTTPCITPRKSWNGSPRRVSTRSICS